MKQIKLSRGKFAIVDDENFEILSKFKWHCLKSPYTFYATRRIYCPRSDGKKGTQIAVRMHVAIMKPDGSFHIDHKNRNGLDNRKENLRVVTRSQNGMNRKLNKNNQIGFKGVHFCNTHKKYVSRIGVNGKRKMLGRFHTAVEAAMVYDAASMRYHGEYGRRNFKYE